MANIAGLYSFGAVSGNEDGGGGRGGGAKIKLNIVNKAKLNIRKPFDYDYQVNNGSFTFLPF